jgi:hypothetical protein
MSGKTVKVLVRIEEEAVSNLGAATIGEINLTDFAEYFYDNREFGDLFLEFSFSAEFLEALFGTIDNYKYDSDLPFSSKSEIGIWLDALSDELQSAPALQSSTSDADDDGYSGDYTLLPDGSIWEQETTNASADQSDTAGTDPLPDSGLPVNASLTSPYADVSGAISADVAVASEKFKLGFATYVDGSMTDLVRDIATDADGNVYITGGTEAFDLVPITAGNNYFNQEGPDTSGWFRPQDVFVHKYNKDGDLLWATRIGGINYDRAYAIEVDADGGVYVAGRAGEGFFTTDNALQETFGGNTGPSENRPYGPQDGFVSKLDAATGQLAWSTYFGGAGGEIIRDIDVDGVIHIGQTYTGESAGQHISDDALNPNLTGQTDEIYAQLSNDGSTLLYGTYVGGTNQTTKSANPAVIVDANGDINMLMYTDDTDAFTTAGAFQSTVVGEDDLYLVKYDGSTDGRTIKSATYFGTEGREILETHNLAIDPSGNFIVSGETTGKKLPNTANGFQPNQGGGITDGFISIISTDGSTVLASTFFGGSGRDLIEGIFYTDKGIFVTGTTDSDDLPVTDTSTIGGYQAGNDGFLALFSHDLSTLKYATYYGGSGNDAARAVHVSDTGEVYLGGVTRSDDLPVLNADQGTKSNWFAAGFLAQLVIDDTADIAGSAISVTASARIDGGPAEAWVLVNGAIVGEIIVTADRSLGEQQTFSIDAGRILSATDAVEVRFHNDLYKPWTGQDRNLFLHEISIDGEDLFLGNAELTGRHAGYNASVDTIALASDGGAVFAADETFKSIITLTGSADLYQGAPIVEVYVNGTSVGEATVQADRSIGETAMFDFGSKELIESGDVLELRYVNDAYGGASGDRNVYFDDLSIDNTPIDMSAVQITATHGNYNSVDDFVVLSSEGSAIFDIL